MKVEQFLKEKSQRVEKALTVCIQGYATAPAGLVDAMNYSLFAGGKRLRPALVLGTCEMICGEDAPAMLAACALEMIHTYSLIHDDLPCMDNDDLRRGRPTSHRQFDEATAILAGDALLTMAFFEISRTGRADAVAILAEASGVAGMVGGQFYDMQAQGSSGGLEHLQKIHACKTGALITAALRLGGLFGGATETQQNTLTLYGHHLGMLFQITDDILDVTGNAAVIGKSTGKDAQTAKMTYPSVVGLKQARAMAMETADAACNVLACFGSEADIFRDMVRYILDRDR